MAVSSKTYSFGYHFWGAVQKAQAHFLPFLGFYREAAKDFGKSGCYVDDKTQLFSSVSHFWHIRKRTGKTLKI